MSRRVLAAFAVLFGLVSAGCQRTADTSKATTPGTESDSRQRPEDRELARQLIGAWETPQTDQAIIWGIQTFDPNGTATYAGWVEIGGKKQAISIGITWRVEEKKLHETVTRSTVPEFIREGKTWSDDIVEVTDKKLVTRDSRGTTETRLRIGK